uniref:7TM_GPCR_Srx domain-containing protein n=1 Tax=Steinernema glaseri TaxID=37863 RepID=A0A1I7Y3X5_9BILA
MVVSRVTAGLILLCLTVPGLICSLLVIKIIIWSRRLRKITAYRVILQLSVAECILLLGHVISATMPLANQTYGYWVNKIIAAVLQSSYICVLLLNVVLAFNRLYTNTSMGPNVSNVTYRMLTLVTYVITAIELICYLTPLCSMEFSLDTFNWLYDERNETALMLYIVEQEKVIALGAILFELACYICIVGVITRRRSAVVTSISSPYNPEYRILVTSLVAFFYQTVMIVPFHFGNLLFPDARWLDLLNAATWAFFPALQQISIIALNSEFRKRLRRMIYARKELTSSAHISAVLRRRNTQNS